MNLTTNTASALYLRILDYFIMACDPQYRTLCQYAKKINAIPHASDREQLTRYFEQETRQKIDYFKNESL